MQQRHCWHVVSMPHRVLRQAYRSSIQMMQLSEQRWYERHLVRKETSLKTSKVCMLPVVFLRRPAE